MMAISFGAGATRPMYDPLERADSGSDLVGVLGGPPITEATLSAARAGDDHAWCQIYDWLGPDVLSWSRRWIHQPQEAEDVAAEVFLRLVRLIHRVPTSDKLRPFTYGIHRQILRERRRSWWRLAQAFARLLREQDPYEAPTQPEREAEARRVMAAVERLPLDLQEVLVAIDLNGLYRRETADALGLTEGVVASRLSRARKELRVLLGVSEPGPPETSTTEVNHGR